MPIGFVAKARASPPKGFTPFDVRHGSACRHAIDAPVKANMATPPCLGGHRAVSSKGSRPSRRTAAVTVNVQLAVEVSSSYEKPRRARP